MCPFQNSLVSLSLSAAHFIPSSSPTSHHLVIFFIFFFLQGKVFFVLSINGAAM